MITTTTVLLAIAAYLLGSIPSAVLAGKAFYGLDVREHGSNSAGATNTFRVLGKPAGSLVLLLDVFKGATAANLVLFGPELESSEYVLAFKIAFGLLAVVGHIYPVFAGFKGGKGIACLLGMVIALDPILGVRLLSRFLNYPDHNTHGIGRFDTRYIEFRNNDIFQIWIG